MRPRPGPGRLLLWALLCAAALLQGCSTLGAKSAGAKLDPWENWNRKVFHFNERLDENVLKPTATAYSNVVPRPVRSGCSRCSTSRRSPREQMPGHLLAGPVARSASKR